MTNLFGNTLDCSNNFKKPGFLNLFFFPIIVIICQRRTQKWIGKLLVEIYFRIVRVT